MGFQPVTCGFPVTLKFANFMLGGILYLSFFINQCLIRVESGNEFQCTAIKNKIVILLLSALPHTRVQDDRADDVSAEQTTCLVCEKTKIWSKKTKTVTGFSYRPSQHSRELCKTKHTILLFLFSFPLFSINSSCIYNQPLV